MSKKVVKKKSKKQLIGQKKTTFAKRKWMVYGAFTAAAVSFYFILTR